MNLRGRALFGVVTALVLVAAQGQMMRIVNQCCNMGRQWFQTTRRQCDPHPGIHSGSSADRATCKAVAEVCCLTLKRESQCMLGQETAKLRKHCEQLHGLSSHEDARECCSCCLLGLLASDQNLPCSTMDSYSTQCSGSFRKCCQENSNTPTINTTLIPPTTVTPTTPTTTTTMATTSTTTSTTSTEQVEPEIPGGQDICQRFEGRQCDQICVPTFGNSFRCACRPGYQLLPDGRSCRENAIGSRCDRNNPCQHECIDTGVAIQCRCFEGYIAQEDGRICTDLNECTTGIHSCTDSETCENTEGGFRCVASQQPTDCEDGFAWNRIGRRCEDIDECILRRDDCSEGEECINLVGSFRCVSFPDEPDTDPSPEPPLRCGTGFIFRINPRSCVDVNECDAETPPCQGQHQTCHNTNGSYRCVCSAGYLYSQSTDQCEDLDECAMSRDTCLRGQRCENTIGSYRCARNVNCGTGYTLDAETQRCFDVDECFLGTHNCGLARECRNIPGSFRCDLKECPYGYKLNTQTGRCDPVTCPRGFKPDPQGHCIDRNECVETPQVCRSNQECRNTVGSYTCRNRITCGPGYEVRGSRCIDIDECERDTHECRGAHMLCVNRPGTYMCQCPDGYQLNRREMTCQDIDECARYNNRVCSPRAVCENTEGSFRCICADGFESIENGRHCRDINECEREGVCQHSCRNTWGSYACTCNDGYQLGPDGRSCVDVDECAVWSARGGRLCSGICRNTEGSYRCECPAGYTMLSDGRTCQDIDECIRGEADCDGPNDVCINIRGGFKCKTIICPNGFVRVPSLNSRSNPDEGSIDEGHLSSPEERLIGDAGAPASAERGCRLGEFCDHREARGPVGRQTYFQLDSEQNVVCQRLNCAANDIPCFLNRTKSMQWQHVVLPSMHTLPLDEPLIILNVFVIGYSIYPYLTYTIVGGNEERLFDVIKHDGSQTTGSVRLLRPVSGPAEYTIKLRMDNRNSYNTIVSSHVAFIDVYVSGYEF